MMKPDELKSALSAFEMIETPREKDREIIDMIKSYMNETIVREYVRTLLTEWKLANDQNLMLDQEGMEKKSREKISKYLKSLGLLESVGPSVFPGDKYTFPISPYPPVGSAEGLEDLVGVVNQYHNRKVPQDLQGYADTDMDGLFEKYLDHKGITYNTEYYSKLRLGLTPLIHDIKDFYARKRPSATATTMGVSFDGDALDTAQTYSYPSGHTIQAYVIAHLLSDQFPTHFDGLMGIAELVSQSRIDRGVHFPSDVRFGRVIAKIIVDEMRDGSV
jgi:acid phosphatase (class A)